jgi:hypothetical protein
MDELDPAMTDRFEKLRAFLTALGDDVQETRFAVLYRLQAHQEFWVH